jgi:hypothetical protein
MAAHSFSSPLGRPSPERTVSELKLFWQKSFRSLPGWPATLNRRPTADLSAPVRPQWHESQGGRTGLDQPGGAFSECPDNTSREVSRI